MEINIVYTLVLTLAILSVCLIVVFVVAIYIYLLNKKYLLLIAEMNEKIQSVLNFKDDLREVKSSLDFLIKEKISTSTNSCDGSEEDEKSEISQRNGLEEYNDDKNVNDEDIVGEECGAKINVEDRNEEASMNSERRIERLANGIGLEEDDDNEFKRSPDFDYEKQHILQSGVLESCAAGVEEWVKKKNYLSQGITLDELSSFIGVGRSYVSIYINRVYGLNFNSWVNELRIEEAIVLMTSVTPRYTLSQIADMTGFYDSTALSKVFKKKKGVLPSDFRKSLGR